MIDKNLKRWRLDVKREYLYLDSRPISRTIINMALVRIFSSFGAVEYNKVVEEFKLDKHGFKKKEV